MRRKVYLVIFFTIYCMVSSFGYGAIPALERAALIALYNSANGENWVNKTGWKTPPLHTDGFALPGTEGTWYGVTTQKESATEIDHVTQLNLASNNLRGIIPTQLSNLSNLQILNLQINQLSGAIPYQLRILNKLTSLSLNHNLLTGVIPYQLGNLINLQYLYLQNNQLSGNIPPELGNLINLLALNLQNNQLTGRIPPKLGNLTQLTSLSLGNNLLGGNIPWELANLTNLNSLQLQGNQLTGNIPFQLGSLSKLEYLSLASNLLSGIIPPELGNLTRLTYLDISSNELSGEIPPSLLNLSNVIVLDVGFNCLYATDQSLIDWLNTYNPSWELTQLTTAVSGKVTTGDGKGLGDVVMNGLPGNPKTDPSGEYKASVCQGWSGTVTPTLAGYAFTPKSTAYTNITLDQTTDYEAAPQTFTISGTVTSRGSGLADVVMNGLPGNPKTDASGKYTASVDYGWSGTVTPDKVGYVFTPPSTVYDNVVSDYTTNYTADAPDYTLSGTVKLSDGTPIAEVVMTGLPGNPKTDASGKYSVKVPYDWSGTVTPTNLCYTFTPASRTFTHVKNDEAANYTGALISHTISGTIKSPDGSPIPDVEMTGFPEYPTPKTDASGKYTATVPCCWTGKVTPVKPCYTFTPSSTAYPPVTDNQTTDYTGTLISYTISGTVTTASGSPIKNVALIGLPGNPVTNEAGQYSVQVPCCWTGKVIPVKQCYTFTEESTAYLPVSANIVTNYIGTITTFTISGTIKTSDGTPIPGVLLSGLPANPVTDAKGQYRVIMPCGWFGTVTPIKECFTFSPTSTTYPPLTANQITDYVGTAVTHTVSGTIKTSDGTPIAGVLMSGLPGNPVTNQNGQYSAVVPCCWTGKVTPTKECYSFTPPFTDYPPVNANQVTNYLGTLNTYTISGVIKTSEGMPIVGVVMNGLPGNPITDNTGAYSAVVPCGWTGTVTPTHACYTFVQPSTSYSNVMTNFTTNYTGTIINYTISGVIKDPNGNPIPDVVMIGLPENTKTDATGRYTATVPCGWSGTVTPTHACYTFVQPSTSYSNVMTNYTTNYTGTIINYTISGVIKDASGTPIPDVVMIGLPGNPKTDLLGRYARQVPCGWTGSVTPTKPCYVFDFPSTSYENVTSNITTGYVATIHTYTISGTITDSSGTPIPDVVMNGLPENTKTDASGKYTATVPCGWSGTVTPTKTCYTFTPPSRSYTNVTSYKAGEDYVAVLIPYTISGVIKDQNGNPIPDVVMIGLPENTKTDATGKYTATVPCGWTGTVTPTKTCYTFTPPSTSYTNVTANQTTDYTGKVIMIIISIIIKDPNGNPIPDVNLNGLTGSAKTDLSGSYNAQVPCGWSGTVTPTKTCYTFVPPFISYTNLTSNQTANFTGTIIPYTISGTIKDSNGNPIPDVVMIGLPGNPKTDATGKYSATVPCGWSGTVTPSKTCYTFTPPSTSYTNVTANQITNYTGTIRYYTISGIITDPSGTPIPDVVLNGFPGNPKTDATGKYSATVPCGWTGTVTPTKTCYTFTPPSRSYTNINSDKTGEDYVAVLIPYTISGIIKDSNGNPIPDVVMIGLPRDPKTDPTGKYTATVPCGWSGIVTPTKACYTFAPPSTTYTNVTANQTTNYTGTIIPYTISGVIKDSNGNPIPDVTVTGLPGNPKTDPTGKYTATVPCGWSGMATPTKACYTFNPISTTYTNVTANQITNYTGTIIPYTISGTIKDSNGNPIPDVVMIGLPRDSKTDATGKYTATVPCGWSGIVTPTKACYTFAPPSTTYTNVTANQITNYTGTIIPYTISGTIKDSNGNPISDVTVTGLPGNSKTDANGKYSATVPCGWSGTVTPTKACYTFAPPSTTYTNVTANQITNYTGTIIPYTISGTIKDSNGNPIPDVVMIGLPENPKTDPTGKYTATVPCGWSGMATPTKACYTLAPPSTTYMNVTANQITNYTGTIIPYTISGVIKDSNGNPIPDVVLTGLPGNSKTDATGKYSATVPCGWSGKVTPTHACYTFEPPSTSYSNVTSNQTTNYTGKIITIIISIIIKDSNGNPIPYVILNGLPGVPKTGANGKCVVTVPCGWSGTITPVEVCYTFTPPSISYVNLTSSQTAIFTGTIIPYTISGVVKDTSGTPIPDVTMIGLPENPKTDPTGKYTATVPCGWTGKVTPTHACYTFEPPSTSYSNVTSNQTTNYTGTIISYTISGTVKDTSGNPIPDVIMNGLPGNPKTDPTGKYTATVPCGWSGKVTPTHACYTFEPPSTSYSNVMTNYTTNYTGTIIPYTISGTVKDTNGNPISDVTMNGLPGPPKTDSTGKYTGTVPCGWTGTVRPTKTCYTFNPSSKTYSPVTSRQTTNYTGSIRTYTISGVIKDQNGNPIPDVVMNGLPGNPKTDSTGKYSVTVLCGWSGKVTPTHACYTFAPPSTSYSNVMTNYTTNYTGTIINYTISGVIKDRDGNPISDVTVTDLPGDPKTDATGKYSAIVPCGWSGKATPTKTCYIFNPISTTYTNVTANQTTNYTGEVIMIIISIIIKLPDGNPLPGVAVNGLPGNPKTDATGKCAAKVSCGWSGTITPFATCYTFTPPFISYVNVTSNQTATFTGTTIDYTISGVIKDQNGNPIPDVVLTGLPGNPKTDATGRYTVIVPCGWSGIITPIKTCYTFGPISITYTNVTSSQTTNYIGTIINYIISGVVKDQNGNPIPDVTMNGLPGNPKTDATGKYTATVPCGWSGTATPTKACYTFNPISTTYTNVTANQTTNYTGTLTYYIISGVIKDPNGNPIPDVVLNGLPGNPKTDPTGKYSVIVPCGWSGIITPTKTCYTFSPPSRSYTNVTSNKTGEDYTAIINTVRISGNVGIPGVQIGSTVSDTNGNYSFEVPCGFSGVITPIKSCYTFSPPSRTYTNLTSSQSGQNYVPVLLTYKISGNVGIPGVQIGSTVSDVNGNYSFEVPCGFSGIITPIKNCYIFTPQSRSYTNVSSDKPGENYTATLINYTISGTITDENGKPVAGVALNGLPGSPKTNSSGNYSVQVPCGWSGVVTPFMEDATFTPSSRSYTNVTANQANQNYSAVIRYTLYVFVDEGVEGGPERGQYSYKPGEYVSYTYKIAIVYLDNTLVSRSGKILMNQSHTLVVYPATATPGIDRKKDREKVKKSSGK
ncbi:MAG: hypothetical protein ACM3SY_00280 [Candidatus Omnitrophota bacterium]